MERRSGGSFRLTNKTAIHLRRYARRVQTAGFAFAAVFTCAMAAAAVWAGLHTLWAVLPVVLAAVLADALMITCVRAAYFRLLGAAICTEASARELAEGMREQRRRQQAEDDLKKIREDAEQAARRTRTDGQGVLSFPDKMDEKRRDAQITPLAQGRTQVMPAIKQPMASQPPRRPQAPKPPQVSQTQQVSQVSQVSQAGAAQAHRRRRTARIE